MKHAVWAALLLVLASAGPAGAQSRDEAIVSAMRLPADELGRALETSRWRDDRLFLAAVAQNPAATGAMLDAIAQRADPALHEKLHASSRLLGTNRKGLAVMRLVALHPNVTEATLVRLSASRNEYVINSVLGNGKTPEAVLRKFAGQDNYLYDWGIAQNPRTPPDLLVPLASSTNEYTRSGVARNPRTPVTMLERLADDREWHVRRDVAMNPSAPRDVLVRLAADADERVRRQVESALRARGGATK
jgi:Leucine rich repeat variant